MKINLDLTEKNKHKHFFREIKIPCLLTKYEMYDWNNLEPDKHDEEMNNYCTPKKYHINKSIQYKVIKWKPIKWKQSLKWKLF